MGSCRFLNVILATTATSSEVLPWPLRLHLAAVVGLYIVGVTWFARTEAKQSDPARLRWAAAAAAAALLLALLLPLHVSEGTSSALFPYLLVAFGFATGLPAQRAWAKPEP